MKEYYSINDLCEMTMLSSRTIRNYINQGLLEGEKMDGMWQFTQQHVEEFLDNPNVIPALRAKNNAIVYDFLQNKSKKNSQLCAILDLPGDDPEEVSEFFCNQINNGDFGPELEFSFEKGRNGYIRVILKGYQDAVMTLLNRFHNVE